jgi:hypothetical protein
MTRPNESGGGGMTGATGDLTPDDADRPFVPAEQREISDPEPHEDATEDTGDRPAGGTSAESGGDELSDHDERF